MDPNIINIPHLNIVTVSSHPVPTAIAAGAVEGGVAIAIQDPMPIMTVIAAVLILGITPEIVNGITILPTKVTVTAFVIKFVVIIVMVTIINTR